ncbi:translation initiation factor [Sulfurimonas paralvinellae]|uniref:Translation initiation factor n=1 Tax=Sulfurimonas paralvinellae TaxID=317658 RepID=A0A7M1B6C3_9BACT|nr:translation initiation factor [Sulfurimonas paralvinellae]QOP45210.1 translation initiation factor [Sulfurimonas paralvinellae]
MSRGKKLDLFIGADFKDEWSEVQTAPKNKPYSKISEPGKHMLHFSKEKRRGKTVTLVSPFELSKEDASTLLKRLKKRLGCGGSYKNGIMEFQGELKEKIRPLLIAEGFRFKQDH